MRSTGGDRATAGRAGGPDRGHVSVGCSGARLNLNLNLISRWVELCFSA
jgi:hypothetical protein